MASDTSQRERRARRNRIIQRILGWTLVIVGVPLYPMPIPLGLVCIAAGLVLLARSTPAVRRRLGALRRWFPGLYEKVAATRDRDRLPGAQDPAGTQACLTGLPGASPTRTSQL